MKTKDPWFYPIAIIGLLLTFTFGCKKDEPVESPTLTTLPVTEITSNRAKSGGNITDDGGGGYITARGVVWSTEHNPTLEDNEGFTEDGTGTGEFLSELIDLAPATKYYVRAYATNSVGTGYGSAMPFTTLVPTLTTADVIEITQTTASSGGNITDDGGAAVTVRGVCWSTIQNPTINDSKTEDGTGTGSFISNITGLVPNKTYYARAYATNSEGTGYGNQVSFETIEIEIIYGYGVTDADGNNYITVIIGEQEWMAENLRTTKYKYGNPIFTGLDDSEWGETTEGAYAIYTHTEINGLNSDAEVFEAYGALYNWYAVETGKLCPTGWHVPNNQEWDQIVDYIINTYNLTNNGEDTNGVGNKLKSCRQTETPFSEECNTNEHPRWEYDFTHFGTDEFGFSALPAGFRGGIGCFNIGYGCHLWSSTENSNFAAWSRSMGSGSGNVNFYPSPKVLGFSVLCVKD